MPLKTKAAPLQRGSACLSCRKRKMRCDGNRPSCSQCIKAHRADTCDFDDRHRRSRTQKLQEQLSALERKLRKLEDVSVQSPTLSQAENQPLPPCASDNAHNQYLPDPISTVGLPTLIFDHVAPSNFMSAFEPFETVGSPSTFPESVFDFMEAVSPSDSSSSTGASFDPEPRIGFQPSSNPVQDPRVSPQLGDTEPPSVYYEQELLAIFLAHCHQFSFEFDANWFQFPDRRPHPALMNAIYLSACYFSQSPWFAELKTYFYEETLNAIAAGLEQSDRLIDVASALSLVAVYQYANCRISEGYRHSFAAARLVTNLGLHQISGTACPSQDAIVPPVRDGKELRHRISVFWQVYSVDRSWSVANGLPTAFPGGLDSGGLKIETPLPRPMTPGTLFLPALRAEAITLFERAYRLSSSYLKDDSFRAERQEVGKALDQFSLIIPPFFGSDVLRTQSPGIDVDILAIHTMINVGYIFVQRDFLGKCMAASEKCLKAAHTVSCHIRQLNEGDYQFLDPIISTCWKAVGMLYIHLIVVSDKSNNRAREMHGVARELSVVIFALKKLGNIFPIAGQHATMLEQERFSRCCNATSGSI